jgi:hypothetical protein
MHTGASPRATARRALSCKDVGDSLPEDKLAGDLGNVIEATSIRRSSVRFFYSRKIGAGQFGTFATISARTSPAVASVEGLLTEVLRTVG